MIDYVFASIEKYEFTIKEFSFMTPFPYLAEVDAIL